MFTTLCCSRLLSAQPLLRDSAIACADDGRFTVWRASRAKGQAAAAEQTPSQQQKGARREASVAVLKYSAIVAQRGGARQEHGETGAQGGRWHAACSSPLVQLVA